MERETVPTRVMSGSREHETMQSSAHSATRASQQEWTISWRTSERTKEHEQPSREVHRPGHAVRALYSPEIFAPHFEAERPQPTKVLPKRALRMLPQKASRKESKSGPWHSCARISLPSIFTRSRGDGIGHMQGVSGANVMGRHDPKRYSL